MLINLMCSWCGKDFKIIQSEFKRQFKKGRKSFFCSRSCAAKKGNATRPNKRIIVQKICPHCKSSFSTLTGCKSATFCSRSCASAGSVTKKRLDTQRKSGFEHLKNLNATEETLRLREGWKYSQLKLLLEFCNEPFEFESRLGDFVFDLALPNKFIFIEFDGDDHDKNCQLVIDIKKDQFAKQKGWKVIRKKIMKNTVIQPDVIFSVLSSKRKEVV